MCLSKGIDDISDNNSDINSSTGELFFLDTISSKVAVVNEGSQPWTVVLDLRLNSRLTLEQTLQSYQKLYTTSLEMDPLSSADRIFAVQADIC